MKITTALKLVIELAEQNSLESREADTPELVTEKARQERAIKKTRKLLKSLSFFQASRKPKRRTDAKTSKT